MRDQSVFGRGSNGYDAVQPDKIFDGYLSAWSSLAGEWSGAGKSVAHVNIELATLASRRAKAYLNLPSQLATCRLPQDFANLQLSFWQTCMGQYTECARNVGRYVSEVQSFTGIDESLSDPDSADVKSTRITPRDYITFPEPQANATDTNVPAQAPAKRQSGEGRTEAA